MPSAAIYCRISRDVRDDHLGVDRQERLCRKLAHERGLDVAHVLIDNDVSAMDRRRARPQFEHLVELLETGQVGAVVAYHSDRLYRRNTDLERLVDIVESTKATVHTVAAGEVDLGTASGKMLARMLGAAAQHESERTGERSKLKHDELAAKGNAPGGRPPFGYRRLLPGEPDAAHGYAVVPAEAAAIRFIVDRALAGDSCLSIARQLDAQGVTTREGRPWHSSTVRAVVVNPAVAGLRVHRREVAGPGTWPAILGRDEWELVRATVADPARKRSKPARRHLLAGLVFTTAGDRMNGKPTPQGRRAYVSPAGSTESVQIDGERLEEWVVERALVALRDFRPSAPSVPTADSRVAELEAELAELARLRGERVIAMGEWLAAREPLERDLNAARAALAPARPKARLLDAPDLAAAWKEATVEEQRQAVAAVVERVVIAPTSRGRWATIDERAKIKWRA